MPNERHYAELEARLTASVSERMLELARLKPDTRLLDIASGRGEPALRAAPRVARVLGVDVSERVLAEARAQAVGFPHVEFRALDAETLELDERFDVATARWGLMYMRSPERALAAIHRALVPDGLLVAALWGEAERVSWATVPREVAARFVPLPPTGAFRLAQFEREFTSAGFVIEHVEEHDVSVVEAETGAGIVDWVQVVLSRLAELIPESQRARFEQELAAEAELHRRDGLIRLGGLTRLVVARRR